MLYTSANLTDKRSYTDLELYPVRREAIVEWFRATDLLVWNEELKVFNSNIDQVNDHYLEQMLTMQNGLRFDVFAADSWKNLSYISSRHRLTTQKGVMYYVYAADEWNNLSDLSSLHFVSLFAHEEKGYLSIQFSPWHSKNHVTIALAIAHYFDAVISMGGSHGIVDENYLKNFKEDGA